MDDLTFTVLCPFGGAGAGALGFVQAEINLLGYRAGFELLGGWDIDGDACDDFRYLTGSDQWHRDMNEVSAADLRQRYGARSPDVIFTSPPCTGHSGLVSSKRADSPKYQALNKLAVTCIERVLEAWADNPPGLILFENVPRIQTRGHDLLAEVRSLLRKANYAVNERTHDCGELGGLAQHRRLYLMVARHKKRVPPLLFVPAHKRVRACGEVLGQLPLPEMPEAGPMHRLPRVSWKTWVRLALIPAGGDWRDLPGVLEEGQKKRTEWARQHIAQWGSSTSTVAGDGSNGAYGVGDPRLGCAPHAGSYGVLRWEEPSGTVTGAAGHDNGRFSVGDPRIRPDKNRHWNKLLVLDWSQPTKTVTGSVQPESGGQSIADPRAEWFRGPYGVMGWEDPSGTVIGNAKGAV